MAGKLLKGRKLSNLFSCGTAEKDEGDEDATPTLRVVTAKVVVVGDGAVGKTSMLMRFVTNQFDEQYEPTIFENQAAPVLVKNKKVLLNLFDTAGQESYEHLRPFMYPETDVVLVCFSVDSMGSLLNVKEKWIAEVRHHLPKVPVLLLGLKTDLRGNSRGSTSTAATTATTTLAAGSRLLSSASSSSGSELSPGLSASPTTPPFSPGAAHSPLSPTPGLVSPPPPLPPPPPPRAPPAITAAGEGPAVQVTPPTTVPEGQVGGSPSGFVADQLRPPDSGATCAAYSGGSAPRGSTLSGSPQDRNSCSCGDSRTTNNTGNSLTANDPAVPKTPSSSPSSLSPLRHSRSGSSNSCNNSNNNTLLSPSAAQGPDMASTGAVGSGGVVAASPPPFVTFTDGHRMAEEIGARAYFECSAKANEGLTVIFQEAGRAALKYRRASSIRSIFSPRTSSRHSRHSKSVFF